MEMKQEMRVERKGSMLEGLVENILKSAGFEVQRNTFLMGFEIDVLASFGDRTILFECKQYERSYLPVKNLIFQWKGKNELIKADCAILVIYGIEISDEDLKLARDCEIQIWGIQELNHFLTLINDKEKLCSGILAKLELKERDIAETNELTLKSIIMETILTGGTSVPEETKSGVFRKALRNRIITNLKEYGSTAEVRAKHIDFFENVIKDIKIKKVLLFKFKKKLSNKQVWEDITNKLNELKPFDDETNSKYIDYIRRLEEGFQEYEQWFLQDKRYTHQRLIATRISTLGAEEFAELRISDKESIGVRNEEIKFDESKIKELNILEWILTDLNYQVVEVFDEKKRLTRRELHWYPGNFEETVEYVCRLLYEYYGIQTTDKLIDYSLPHATSKF